MNLPPQAKKKIYQRFDELIKMGEGIISDSKIIPGKIIEYRYSTRRLPDKTVIDWSRFVQWRVNCRTLFAHLFQQGNIHYSYVEDVEKMTNTEDNVQWGIATLKALKENLENGFLSDLSSQIEAEIAADYMTQAANLIDEGADGAYNHVPAAVLSGAVLEKTLRELCEKQEPTIATIKNKGEYKTMNPLIDDLRRSGVYNETRAKQLRHFADIRNHAAHGRFGEFSVDDVRAMIDGINRFISEYLG